jgi:hypothetical protein
MLTIHGFLNELQRITETADHGHGEQRIPKTPLHEVQVLRFGVFSLADDKETLARRP